MAASSATKLGDLLRGCLGVYNQPPAAACGTAEHPSYTINSAANTYDGASLQPARLRVGLVESMANRSSIQTRFIRQANCVSAGNSMHALTAVTCSRRAHPTQINLDLR